MNSVSHATTWQEDLTLPFFPFNAIFIWRHADGMDSMKWVVGTKCA